MFTWPYSHGWFHYGTQVLPEKETNQLGKKRGGGRKRKIFKFLSKICSNLYFARKIGQNFSNFHHLTSFLGSSHWMNCFLEKISHQKIPSFELLSEHTRHLQSWLPGLHATILWLLPLAHIIWALVNSCGWFQLLTPVPMFTMRNTSNFQWNCCNKYWWFKMWTHFVQVSGTQYHTQISHSAFYHVLGKQ